MYSLRNGFFRAKPKFWLEFLAYAVLLVMLAVSLFSVQIHGVKLQSIHTNALRPALQSGDAIVVHAVQMSDVSPQDIVSYYDAPHNSPRVGQVVLADKATRTLQVKTTSQHVATVPSTKLIGKADARIVWLGKLLDFWHSVPGLVVLVYLPTAVILLRELQRLARHYDYRAYRLRRYT